MLKKLIQFLISLKPFNKINTYRVDLPKYIDDPERIVRVLFYPKMVTKDRKSIRSNAYRTPPEKDEVSVLRQDYCSATFCKEYGKKIQDPKNKKAYFGFGLLTAVKIRNVDADVVYSPKADNDYHADIKIGYIPKKGEQLPAEYKFKVDEMAKMAKLYIDPNPSSNEWEGEDLIY
jgi:hypothetical protein